MTLLHSTTTAETKHFSHLTLDQRRVIERNLRLPRKSRLSIRKLANILGVHPSSVCREIKRGLVEQQNTYLQTCHVYVADTAHLRYMRNRSRCRHQGKSQSASAFIHDAALLIKNKKRSPEQAWALIQKSASYPATVCVKTLYNYISKGLLSNVNSFDLRLRLCRKLAAKRQKRHLKGRVFPPNCFSIEDHPKELQFAKEPGHLEIDTIVGTRAKGKVLLPLDDRMTRMRHMVMIPDKTAASTAKGLAAIMRRLPTKEVALWKSITCDNGSEFRHLAEQFPHLTIYLARPYASYERGLNELQMRIPRIKSKQRSIFSYRLLKL